MVFDFSFFLVLATVVTGVIWAVDAYAFKPRRVQRAGGTAATTVHEPVLVEYARSFFPIILVVLVIRSFLFEPFRIPSDSMMPTLLDGDFIFVNKFTYGLRLPVLNTEVVGLGAPDHRVELDADELGDRQAERAGQRARHDLRDERLRPLSRAVELQHVEAVVVRLDQGGQRAALA